MINILLISLLLFIPVGLIAIVYIEWKTPRETNNHIDYFVGE